MYYYEVFVSSPRYHGSGPLTYSCDEALSIGQVVSVPLQRQVVLGVVANKVPTPQFKTKPVVKQVTSTPIPTEQLALLKWLLDYYPAPLGQTLPLFLPTSLKQASRNAAKTPLASTQPKKLPKLTAEQTAAVNQIETGNSRTYLLHGDTGSGKTRVYLELAKKQIANNKSVLMLTPEIGLTPQLIERAAELFSGQIVVLHSHLTPAERRDSWLRILDSREPLIIIGPRSALFSPLKNIGLLVLDEAHDQAYKQEQAPHYSTSRVAGKLAEIYNAKLILGSATPLVSDYFAFEQKRLPIIRMTSSAVQSNNAATDVVTIDMSLRDGFARSSWLSDELLSRIETALANKEQSLLFLNRRGTARLVTCQLCGWQALCPRCDLPLTYHGDTHRMQCHTCGYQDKAPYSCPACKSTDITFKSIGTKSLVTELERLFPKARVQRFDGDSKRSERLEEHYKALHAGDVDIVVGTQLLTKGLDLPKLALVGIVVADTSMYFPDYTAEERTYQMLTQVIGRVNRGHRHGAVVIQTYHPSSPIIMAAAAQDYQTFYEQQIAERKLFNFPPFTFVLKIRCERATKASAQKAIEQIKDQLESKNYRLTIANPSPAFVEKVNNRYRWQLIVRSSQRSELLKAIKDLPANCTFDLDPTDLL